MEPNYEEYTIDQLRDVLRVIDKEQYPDRYEKINELLTVHSPDLKPEPVIVKNPDARLMHSPNQIFIGSYWGGPLYSVYALRKNFIQIGNHSAAKKTLIGGMIFIVILIALFPFIPENFPNFTIPIVYCSISKLIASNLQIKKSEIHKSTQYSFESNWKVFGLGAVTLITFTAFYFALIFMISYSSLIDI